MALNRMVLQTILQGILGSDNVYFQPPESVKLQYPCIVYRLNNMGTEFADNRPYTVNDRYQVTLITRNPDDEVRNRIAEMAMCTFDRHYTADNLHHFAFNLYFL